MQVFEGTGESGEVVAYKVLKCDNAEVEALNFEAVAGCRSCIQMHAYLVSLLPKQSSHAQQWQSH